MPQTFVKCNLPCSTQGLYRRGRQILHLIAREEPTEMEGSVGKSVFDEPATHATYHVHIVVDAGDDEVGQLYPHTGITHGQDGVEDSR